MTYRVGQQFGNYQLIKLLGRGGQASVYLGKHRYLNSYAALKALHASLHPGDEHKFLSEAQRLVDLQHPHIVRLLDFGIENETAVLIMDYAPKGSLRQYYSHGILLSLTTVVDFVLQIASALQYAHNHHVIHRDVKPENILLDADNHLRLSDFGLSLLTPSSEQLSTQDPVGTVRYMSPEQLRGKPCFASDQYALAIMVYEWLCGDTPFRGTRWEIWQQHLFIAPVPLRTIRPELPPRLETVVLRALAKKPQDRFVSIKAFAQALVRASQTGTPVEENDSLVTTPLQAIPRSSSIALPDYTTPFAPQNNQIAQMVETKQAPAQGELPPSSTAQNQNRVRMLRRLRRSYSDLISQSLQGTAWLKLGLVSKPDVVQNAAHLLLPTRNHTEELLPTGTSIKEVYDEAEHELLILGEPGAGKSMLLLDLAQQLVERSTKDETHPLPVILPLSSWAAKRPLLEDWIAEQMAQIYDVPRKLCIQWMLEGRILPLLDGLDEMEEATLPACIAAINAYHREHMARLVVCSRTNEYQVAATRHRLALQRAVMVQPLTHEDVDAYLVRAGKSLAPLQSALKKHDALYDLAKTPLMLNILIFTYEGTSVCDLSNQEHLLLQQVWNDYIQRMVERKGNRKRYPLEQTRSRLSWLANEMRKHNQTVFYLEHLQPDWLDARQQSRYVWRAMRLPAIVVGILITIIIQLLLSGGTFDRADLPSLLQFAALGGLLGGLRSNSLSEKEYQGAHLHVWGKRIVVSACIGLIYGLSFGFYLDPYYTPSIWQIDGLSSGILVGLGSLILQLLLTTRFYLRTFSGSYAASRGKWIIRSRSTMQRLHSLLVAIIIGLSSQLGYGVKIELSFGQTPGLSFWLSSGLSSVLSYWLSYELISLALSAQMGGVHLTERMKWSRRHLCRSLFNSRHLYVSILLSCISMIFIGLSVGLSYGLSDALSHDLSYDLGYKLSYGLTYGLSYGWGYGLSIGLSYWLFLGLLRGIAQERIEDKDRRIANQGIHLSLHNGVMIGIIGGLMIGGFGILSYELSFWLSIGLIDGLSDAQHVGLLLGISSALLICALTGGLAVWRHYVIRFSLWRSRIFPWRTPQFLDDATARFLLRRVGGGYSFTHRLLLDHLADMRPEVLPKGDPGS